MNVLRQLVTFVLFCVGVAVLCWLITLADHW
jgi:hypothetical protein